MTATTLSTKATPRQQTETTDDDMKRAVDAMRESVLDIRKKDYCGALMHAELAALLLRIAASKQPKTESR